MKTELCIAKILERNETKWERERDIKELTETSGSAAALTKSVDAIEHERTVSVRPSLKNQKLIKQNRLDYNSSYLFLTHLSDTGPEILFGETVYNSKRSIQYYIYE